MTGTISFTINETTAELPESAQLLSAIRDHLGLTGAKLGCGEGACGACTVLVDGEPVRSCQRTVGSVAGRTVTTIEGLGGGGPAAGTGLHPVQRAFGEEAAAQCGYCTPGMVLTAAAVLAADPRPGDGAIDAALASQTCRCGSYPRIRRAVHRAADLIAGRAVPGAGPSASADAPEAAEAAEAPDAPEWPEAPDGGPDADRWGPPLPGGSQYRPARPWDLSDPADRDWFTVLGDGLVVALDPPPPDPGVFTTTTSAWLHVRADGLVTGFTGKVDVGQDNRTALRRARPPPTPGPCCPSARGNDGSSSSSGSRRCPTRPAGGWPGIRTGRQAARRR